MVHLDSDVELSGYWPSAPSSQSGAEKTKACSFSWLNLAQGESLSTIRETGGWAVMTVQRNPGELYLSLWRRSTLESSPSFQKVFLTWMGRAHDPISLETLNRSKDS